MVPYPLDKVGGGGGSAVNTLTSFSREKPNVNTAPPPSKPEDYQRVNTFYTSLDKVLADIKIRFGGNDQDVLCALGDITLSDSPTSDSFGLVARRYKGRCVTVPGTFGLGGR